jgi:hypothetical protein
LRDVGGEFQLELPVLGVRVRFESNSTTVLECVRETFGDWQALEERPDLIGDELATVRIIVQDEPAPYARESYQFRILPDGRVLRYMPGSFGVSDAERRSSITFVSPSHVADRAQFRFGLIESATVGLLTGLDRQPLHGAAVRSDDVAIILAGPSGTGKSTLVYALARAGFEVLTDDSVYLQLEPRVRVWGVPRFLHLSEESRRFFPDLARYSTTLMANGKRKIAIDAHSRGFTAGLPVSEHAVLCALKRDSGPARIEPLDGAQLEAELLHNPEGGFDVFVKSIAPAIHALAELGGWRLHLGSDPNEAVPLVQSIVQMANERIAAGR